MQAAIMQAICRLGGHECDKHAVVAANRCMQPVPSSVLALLQLKLMVHHRSPLAYQHKQPAVQHGMLTHFSHDMSISCNSMLSSHITTAVVLLQMWVCHSSTGPANV
jgi:hypothetical protein